MLSGRFIGHGEIVVALLADAEASALIRQVRRKMGGQRAAQWIAHNMVAWFSQRISVGQADWEERFERVKIDQKWAYKPKSTDGSQT